MWMLVYDVCVEGVFGCQWNSLMWYLCSTQNPPHTEVIFRAALWRTGISTFKRLRFSLFFVVFFLQISLSHSDEQRGRSSDVHVTTDASCDSENVSILTHTEEEEDPLCQETVQRPDPLCHAALANPDSTFVLFSNLALVYVLPNTALFNQNARMDTHAMSRSSGTVHRERKEGEREGERSIYQIKSYTFCIADHRSSAS